MTTRLQSVLFWSIAAATVAVYLVMVAWSLPRIAVAAGGLAPFDMRPTGYSAEEGRAFLAALSPEGRSFYLDVQHRLDLLYPGLLALTLILALRRLAPGWPGLVLSAIALAGAGFDWAENAAVTGLLTQEPEDSALILANRLTLAKSACTTVALTALLVLLFQSGVRRWRR
jgi:hypothetical protein